MIRKDIGGIVIWYEPKPEYIENIKSYISNIDILTIYDNSKESNFKLLSNNEYIDKIRYVHTGENLGISTPLNKIALEYFKDGYKWLLTMDQDSYFEKGSMEKLVENINKKDCSILAPTYIYDVELLKNAKKTQDKEVKIIITSGNLLNLSDYDEVGGFDELLFIDEVDHDYCIKLQQKNKKIYQIGDAFLIHELGEKNKKFGISYTQHNYIRKYYIWRNKLYLSKKYSFLKKEYLKYLIKDFFKVLFLEDNKTKKIKFILRGIKDFKNLKMRKMNDK